MHYFGAHPKQIWFALVESTSSDGLDTHSIHYYWWLCEVAPTTRLLAWFVTHVRLLLSVLPLHNVWEEGGSFSDGQEECYYTVKWWSQWFHCLQYLVLMYNWTACSTSGTSLSTDFQHCNGKLISIFSMLCRFLLLCTTPMLITIHFQSAYLLYHINTIKAHPICIQFNSLQIHIESISYELHVKVPLCMDSLFHDSSFSWN